MNRAHLILLTDKQGEEIISSPNKNFSISVLTAVPAETDASLLIYGTSSKLIIVKLFTYFSW